MVIYSSISCILFVCVVPHHCMFTVHCIWGCLVHYGGVKSDGTFLSLPSSGLVMFTVALCLSHVLFAMLGVVLWRQLTRAHFLLCCNRNLYHQTRNAQPVICCACHEFVASVHSDWIK